MILAILVRTKKCLQHMSKKKIKSQELNKMVLVQLMTGFKQITILNLRRLILGLISHSLILDLINKNNPIIKIQSLMK